MCRSYSIRELAEVVEGDLRGADGGPITGVDDVREAGAGEATWITNPKYEALLATSKAAVVLVPRDFGPTPMPAILCRHVQRSVAKLLGAFALPATQPDPGIHPTAVIDEAAAIGPESAIGPHVVIDRVARLGKRNVLHGGVYIGQDSVVGDDCVLWPNVVVRDRCIVGNRVIVHPNAVIGADGLGYYFHEGRHHKVPHLGGVLVENDVEIGAGSCIDRAKFRNTVIGQGTKIDNLVQIAHNVKIGKHCVIAAECGIAGSVSIGDYCILGGQVGVGDNVALGNGVKCGGGMTMVAKDIPAGMTVSGFPAQEHRKELRDRAMIRRIPVLADQVKDLLARIDRLEESVHHNQ